MAGRFRFKSAPIGLKLTLLSMATTMSAMVVCLGFLLAFTIQAEWNEMVANIEVEADVIGNNIRTGLVFSDTEFVTTALTALSKDASVSAAAAYTKEGKLFASYLRPGDDVAPLPQMAGPVGVRYQNGYLTAIHPVMFEANLAGYLYLRRNLNEFVTHLLLFVGVVTGSFVAASLLSYFLWRRLQRVITDPLLSLESFITGVSESHDYSVRAESRGEDELGALIGGVNEMLEQIEERDRKLEEHFKNLEEKVTQRTAELKRERDLFVGGPAVAFKWRNEPGWPVEYVSPNVTQFGYSPIDFLGGLLFGEIIHPDDSMRIANQVKNLRLSGSPSIEREYRIVKKDGEAAWLYDFTVIIREEDGEISSFDGYVLDITARKKAEQQIEEARRLAERLALEADMANQAKSEFLANMSHELRTPLNGVIGLTEVVLKSGLPEDQRRKLEMVRRSGENLLYLVNDILDLSRIEAGKLQLSLASFSLREVVEDTASRQAVAAHKKGLELVVSLDHDLPDNLVGDAVRLQQIIVNLIGNAVKFTEEGEVVLTVSLESSSGENEGDEVTVLFSVLDTGIGIPADKQSSVFDRFIQADASSTRRHGGAGLGAAICRELAEMMGGKIWLESEEGVGSRFSFTARFTLGPPMKPSSRRGDISGLRALIIDDNETNRAVMKGALAGWALEADAIDRGGFAVTALKRAADQGKPYDLVLLDFQMPEMDGFMTATSIREEEAFKDIKIILLSSVGGDGAGRMRREGIDAFLFKPVRQSELYNAIAMVMGQEEEPEEAFASNREPDDPIIPLSILVVEDNPINQELAVTLLKQMGHQTVVAENGEIAVRVWEEKDFDMILMDVQMPVMTGLEATGVIRERGGDLPIIALTARAMEGDEEKCRKAGMDDYLSKPINAAKLRGMVAKYYNRALEKRGDAFASATGGGDEIVYDLQALASIFKNNQEEMSAFLNRMVSTMDGMIVDLQKAVEEEDRETIEILAHSIKGSAAQLEAGKLEKIAYALETIDRNATGAVVEETYSGLAAAYETFRKKIDKEMK